MALFVAEPHVDRSARSAGTVRRGRRRIVLLGLGQIGSAVARLIRTEAAHLDLEIAGALVRNPATRSTLPFPVVADARSLLDSEPDVVVEVLGGIEPARSIVTSALDRGIPVVTANKSLLASCGDELFAAAAHAGTPLRYEAAVMAGVPFLRTFTGRPLAARITRVSAILNGTSNFVLTRLAAGTGLQNALALARRCGFAEPDPSLDLDGTDAAEKLAILARHFGRLSIPAGSIPRQGIENVTCEDLRSAAEFAGTIKPLAYGEWSSGATLWVGPAFIPCSHPLSSVRGVANGICLDSSAGDPLVLVGAGAGPDVTAATIVDDVIDTRADRIQWQTRRIAVTEPPTGWFVRFQHVSATNRCFVPDLLASFGVGVERSSMRSGIAVEDAIWILTHACERGRLDGALAAVRTATRCETFAIRALGVRHLIPLCGL